MTQTGPMTQTISTIQTGPKTRTNQTIWMIPTTRTVWRGPYVLSGPFEAQAHLGRRACLGRRTHSSCRARSGPRAHPSCWTRLGLRARLGRWTCLGIRPRPDCRARSGHRARLDRRARSGRWTHLEHWANDLNGLDRAILTNLMAQSCSMGRQASRSSGHRACLGFPIGPTRVGCRV